MKKTKEPVKEKRDYKEVVFLMEKVIHSKNPDITPHQKELVEANAHLIGDSESWCAVCHEPQEGHDRRGRRHAFKSEILQTIEVHHPGQEFVTVHHHVPQGKTANCWKEKA